MPTERACGGVGEVIRAQRMLAKLSVRHLARLSNVSDSYLSQVERGRYRPSAEVVKAIADALGIAASPLYARLGLLEDPISGSAGPGVPEAIARDPRLRPDQRAALLQMYRTLVAGR
jgi:transcriptional regulator with XRE-family HTH domain